MSIFVISFLVHRMRIKIHRRKAWPEACYRVNGGPDLIPLGAFWKAVKCGSHFRDRGEDMDCGHPAVALLAPNWLCDTATESNLIG